MDRIQVEELSKVYSLGERQNMREAVTSVVRDRRLPPRQELWSLREVSFTVGDGEALGILGRNGAGKSTLLKVLMRITTPTEGIVRTRGRVAALLEVGTGFHPELTGRENIFLNAAVLGMTKADTRAHFDEIVAFAGTERFLDTPVKRYSSGMYLRLAFAVAAHLEPDILIVDEVLAVGDAEFQRKCMSRMSTAEREGRTVVFVSHDLASLTKLCRRSIWLEAGSVRDDGLSEQVVRDYLSAGFVRGSQEQARAVGGGPVRIADLRIRSADAVDGQPILRDDPFRVVLDLDVVEEQIGLNVAVYVMNARGVRVFDEVLSDSIIERYPAGRHQFTLDVPPVLNVGRHTVGIWLGTSTSTLLDEPSAAQFELLGNDRNRPERAVVLNLPFRLTK